MILAHTEPGSYMDRWMDGWMDKRIEWWMLIESLFRMDLALDQDRFDN